MNYCVLVTIYVPIIEQKYDMYIPINRTINQVVSLTLELVDIISMKTYSIKKTAILYNRRTGEIYNQDDIVRNTNIRNSTELVIK